MLSLSLHKKREEGICPFPPSIVLNCDLHKFWFFLIQNLYMKIDCKYEIFYQLAWILYTETSFFNKNSYLSIFPLVNFFLLSGRLYEEKCLCRHLQQSSLFSTQILYINSLTYRNLGVNVTLNQAIIKTILVTYEIKSRCILYHFIWNELLWYLRHMVKLYYAVWKNKL